jgi:hypothetical protein
MAVSTVKIEDLNRAAGCAVPLWLDTSRWNSGLALLPPGFRVPARATWGADSGWVSRKQAREGCGQRGPSPLDACPLSATVAGQGREAGSRVHACLGFDRAGTRGKRGGATCPGRSRSSPRSSTIQGAFGAYSFGDLRQVRQTALNSSRLIIYDARDYVSDHSNDACALSLLLAARLTHRWAERARRLDSRRLLCPRATASLFSSATSGPSSRSAVRSAPRSWRCSTKPR